MAIELVGPSGPFSVSPAPLLMWQASQLLVWNSGPALPACSVKTGFESSLCAPLLKSVWNSRRPSTKFCTFSCWMFSAICPNTVSVM